jgi:3-hydroxybutyrate dehydrogenase
MHKLSAFDLHTARPARPLEARSVIVTGSTSGIGLGIARAFAEAGADILLNGFGDPAVIERQRADLARAHDVRVAYSSADLSKPADITAMVAQCSETFGQVDVLVNNAGVFHVAATDSMPPQKWDATLAINLTAAFHAIRAALPGMKARGWGRIINVASALGLVGAPNAAAYAASKHGIVGLTRSVALEVAEDGITANAICPGYVLTPLIERESRETAMARGTSETAVRGEFLAQSMPTRRFVETSELGALAVFLASAAARSITGAALPVDGGWTAR